MGLNSLVAVLTLTFLLACFVLIDKTNAKLVNSGESGSQAAEKRPSSAVWLKSFPVRRLKPINAFPMFRRDSVDVEFADDSTNDIEKRFDDYGHMR